MLHTPEHQHSAHRPSRFPTNVFFKKLALSLSAAMLTACAQVAPSNSVLEREVQRLRQELEEVKKTPQSETQHPVAVPSASSEKVVEEGSIIERNFSIDDHATRIDLQDIIGSVTVEVIEAGEEQGLTVRGDNRLVEKLTHTPGQTEVFRGGRLPTFAIVDGDIYVGGNGNIGGVTIINGVVQSNRYDYIISKEAVPSIVLKLRRGNALIVDSRSGSVKIGDTYGNVELEVSGVGTVEVGRVRNAQLKVSGSAKTTARYVEGDLGIEISGSGDTTVQDGKIGRATIDVSGSGEASILTHVDDVFARVSGSGDVYVKSATTVDKDVSGSGDVKVGEE